MDTGSLLAHPLDVTGWRFETELPQEKKYVCLAFPHTSNWDGLLLVTIAARIGLHLRWMIKREWVRGPMGVLLRRTGAVPIDRRGSHHVVQSMIDLFNESDELVLGIPPEGTRRRAERWRSGFYHIAHGANVPVVPAYLDYRRKRAGFGPLVHLTGDVRADMDRIRAFYASVSGGDPASMARYPDLVGPIRLEGEGPDRTP